MIPEEKKMIAEDELIDKFMGVTRYNNWGEYLSNTYYKINHGRPTNDSPLTETQVAENKDIESKASWGPAKYSTSWSELMPVVEKIETLGFEFTICQNSTLLMNDLKNISDPITLQKLPANKRFEHQSNGTENTKLQCVYQTCVEFIKFYNTQQKP